MRIYLSGRNTCPMSHRSMSHTQYHSMVHYVHTRARSLAHAHTCHRTKSVETRNIVGRFTCTRKRIFRFSKLTEPTYGSLLWFQHQKFKISSHTSLACLIRIETRDMLKWVLYRAVFGHFARARVLFGVRFTPLIEMYWRKATMRPVAPPTTSWRPTQSSTIPMFYVCVNAHTRNRVYLDVSVSVLSLQSIMCILIRLTYEMRLMPTTFLQYTVYTLWLQNTASYNSKYCNRQCWAVISY